MARRSISKVSEQELVLSVTYALLNFINISHFCFSTFLWPPCIADAEIIFCTVISFYLFFIPCLISVVTDVYHTSMHDVALVRI